MPGPRGSLRWKLTLVHWAVIALVLAAGMLYLHVSLSRQLVALAEEGLARDARLALHHLLEAARRGPADADALAHEIGRALGMRVTIIAAGGRLLGDSGLAAQDLERAENHAARPEVVAALRLGMGKDTRRSATVGHPLLYLALPIREGPFAGGVLRLARDLGEVEGTLARMRGILYAGGGLAFLLALGISLGAGEVARRAIGEILRTVEAIIGGDFARRIGSARRDELGGRRVLSGSAALLFGLRIVDCPLLVAMHSGFEAPDSFAESPRHFRYAPRAEQNDDDQDDD